MIVTYLDNRDPDIIELKLIQQLATRIQRLFIPRAQLSVYKPSAILLPTFGRIYGSSTALA